MRLPSIFLVFFYLFARTLCWSPEVSLLHGVDSLASIIPFDDSSTILSVGRKGVNVSHDYGRTWATKLRNKGEYPVSVTLNTFRPKSRAFVFLNGKLYGTHNEGSDWFESKFPSDRQLTKALTIDFSPFAKDVIIASFVAKDNQNDEKEFNYVSTDDGKSFRVLHVGQEYESMRCRFLSISHESNFPHNDNIICMTKTSSPDQNKLLLSENRGKSFKELSIGEDIAFDNFYLTNSYLVIRSIRDIHNKAAEVDLYVSSDAKDFKKAYLPTTLRRSDIRRIIELLGRKMFITLTRSSESNVQDDNGNTLFTDGLVSNSDGLKFTSFSTSASKSRTTITPVEFLNGTFIQKQVGRNSGGYSISIDNGNTWRKLKYSDKGNKNPIKCQDENDCNLELLIPQIFHGPTAGILVMLGHIDDNFSDQQTFISRDGGLNWEMGLEFPGIYATGDLGNVIVACPVDPSSDNDPQSEIYYSLDQGMTWSEYQLDEMFIPIDVINITPDGSGLSFILTGFSLDKPDDQRPNIDNRVTYLIDFNNVHDGKKCKAKDYEKFELAEGSCINGAKYTFNRRKQSAKCIGGEVFKDLLFDMEVCTECQEQDYECSSEFIKDSKGVCVVDEKWLSATGNCPSTDIKKPAMRLIADNMCKKELPIQSKSVSCKNKNPSDPKDIPKKPKEGDRPTFGTGDIQATFNTFKGKVRFYQYFDTDEDESLILATSEGEAYISHDSGQTYTHFNYNKPKVHEIVFNEYFNSSAYIFDIDGNLHVTHDRGYTFDTIRLPASLQLGLPLNFHSNDPNTFIYYGGKNCKSIFDTNCHIVAFITRDGGKSFSELLPNAIHCEFVGSSLKLSDSDDLLFCQVKDETSSKTRQRSLVSTTDYFETEPKVVFQKILGYMTNGEYVIIAVPGENHEITAYVTMDGNEFAETLLPYDLDIEQPEAFTVLGSSTGSVFLHFTSFQENSVAFGSLLKSNTNGTSYVKLQSNVNRNEAGYVDFEKVQGLDGIILTNVVTNADEIKDGSSQKHLRTKITFNDGVDWEYIKPPKKDSSGDSYHCKSNKLEHCSLNLHSYTERKDFRDTFSSGSALGMMIGVGNVGDKLLPFEECSTFLTIDGGKSWTEIKKGAYQWEFGDHGGILILSRDGEMTNSISYSTDFGTSWYDYQFSDEKVLVSDIVTVPQDSALRFLLITADRIGRGFESGTVTVDFSGLFKRQCVLDFNNENHDDFDYFSIGNSENECIFGHKVKYLRKNSEECYVGAVSLSQFTRVMKNCTCTRADFECDYNFVRQYDGTCKLVDGLQPGNEAAICKKDPDLVEYFQSTGYRKIPLSTCQGGLKLDGRTEPLPCPGKEKEFKQKYGISGSSFFMLFFVPFLFFVSAGWFVYDRGIRRNGGFARFGEIRLGDDQLIEENTTDKVVNTIIRFGVASFEVMAGGFGMIRRIANNSFNRITGRMNGRYRPSYSNLMHDDFLDEADDLLAGHDDDANDLASFMDDDSNFDIEDETTSVNDSGYRDQSPETENVVDSNN